MQVENESNDRIGLRVTAMSAMGQFLKLIDFLEQASTIETSNKLKILVLGMRKYMEDTFTVAYQKSDDGKDLDYAFFGMFDG